MSTTTPPRVSTAFFKAELQEAIERLHHMQTLLARPHTTAELMHTMQHHIDSMVALEQVAAEFLMHHHHDQANEAPIFHPATHHKGDRKTQQHAHHTTHHREPSEL